MMIYIIKFFKKIIEMIDFCYIKDTTYILISFKCLKDQHSYMATLHNTEHMEKKR